MLYKIEISGYGAEVTIGTLEKYQCELIKNNDSELIDIVNENFDWRDMDNLYHNFGACSDYLITVKDEHEKVLYEIYSENLSEFDNESNKFELVERNLFEAINKDPAIMCISFQKGIIYETEVIAQEFNIEKLKITIDEEVGINSYLWGDIIRAVKYNEEELCSTGQYTDEKSFEAYVNF